MKTTTRSVVGLLVLSALVWSGIAFAENPPPATYQVQPKDTLWDLSAAYRGDPLKWAEVLGANPFLKEKGRIFNHPDGRVIVLIRPGEELAGLDRIGIKAEMIPIANLGLAPATPASATPVLNLVVASASTESTSVATAPFYQALVFGIPLWLLAVVIILILIVIYMSYRNRLRNQATGRVPMIPGGITASQSATIEHRLERIAERHYGERNPSADLASERPQRISEIARGFLSGKGVVQYRDRTERRRLNREPAYTARFRFPDGSEETLYFLEACANDVVFRGTRYEGFHWEAERTIAPMPAPATQVQPVAVGRTPLRAVPSAALAMTTVAVGDIRVTIPEGSSVALEKDGRIVITVSAACDIAIMPAIQQASAAKTA